MLPGLEKWIDTVQNTPVGASGEVIDSLERHLKTQLPKAYREFLQIFGVNGGSFLVGSDFLVKNIYGTRTWANETIQESGSKWQMPEKAVVFLSHQGYQFLYFDAAAGDDPPVMHFSERGEPRELAKSFTAWFEKIVEEQLSRQK